MGLKSLLAKPYARWQVRKERQWSQRPAATQERVFEDLVHAAARTAFGKDHGFDQIKSHSDFVQRVPVRDYEDLKPYVERIINGEKSVLWPGQPEYLAKTSGTTSGAKYIPITKASMKEQVKSSKLALLNYIVESGNASYVNGKMIFLQGSPVLGKKGAIKSGRLSGISAHYLPNYLLKNRLPSWETNCIEDWETKVEAVVDETITQDMTLIAGIPSWVQMYFERLIARTGKSVGTLFPNFSLFVYGGVNFEPYRQKFESLIGRKVDSVELFPASEGFFAYQDQLYQKGLLLQLNSSIFYEFIRAEEFYTENPKRLTVAEVEKDVDYALIISSNAGLWAYNIGDTVRFVSLNPHRVVVSGRLKHFISAFGEHVIAKEVEEALATAVQEMDEKIEVIEFSVAPQVDPKDPHELPYHEWLIEFDTPPSDEEAFMQKIDTSMQAQNVYYKDLIEGKVLKPAVLTKIQRGGFEAFMKSQGKLGGQNKIKRLSNDRSVADGLTPFCTPMKTIVITGAAGFLGSHLVDRMLAEEYRVIGIDNLITGDLKNLEHLKGEERFEFLEHDVTTFTSVAGSVSCILHFASPASPIDYLKIPIQTLKVGSLGTHNLLGLAKAKNAKFMIASTSEVYGDPLEHPQSENYYGNVNAIGPRGVYDEAKRFQESMTMAYHRVHQLDTRIARIFNTYGPRMRLNDGRVIPAFIGQILREEPLTVFGSGAQTRSFCFVDDLVEGIFRLMASDYHLPVNLGNPDETTILEFAQELIGLTESKSEIVFKPLPEDDPLQRQPDIKLAKELLNWEPQTKRREGLSKTIAYFKGLSPEELRHKEHRTFN